MIIDSLETLERDLPPRLITLKETDHYS